MNIQTDETTVRENCAKCDGIRNCEVICKYNESGSEDHFDWHCDWYLLKCKGCNYVFIKKTSGNSEDTQDFEDDKGNHQIEYVETVQFWPALSKRRRPPWMKPFGDQSIGIGFLYDAMNELYGALNNDLPMLAAIGIRTCFDVAATDLKVDPELSFAGKLDALVSLGKMGIVDRERLESLIDAGSASAHRGWVPSQSELDTMVELLEHFVSEAFVAPQKKESLDKKAKALKDQVPPRKGTKKKVK